MASHIVSTELLQSLLLVVIKARHPDLSYEQINALVAQLEAHIAAPAEEAGAVAGGGV